MVPQAPHQHQHQHQHRQQQQWKQAERKMMNGGQRKTHGWRTIITLLRFNFIAYLFIKNPETEINGFTIITPVGLSTLDIYGFRFLSF